ncbi:MAG: cobalamin biosynthesis protein, partial [Thermoproteus sp.]
MTKRYLILLLALVLIAPIFGVWLANMVGYAEPIDHLGDALGLKDMRYQWNWTPLIDYTVPGLPDWAGYIIAGLIGVA